MSGAWSIYDYLLTDERITMFPEPAELEATFRLMSTSGAVSPKVWADVYLTASAAGHNGQLVTFDRALQRSGVDCLVLT
jgi:hypothetical protein